MSYNYCAITFKQSNLLEMGKIAEVSVTKAGKLKLTTDGYTYIKNKDEFCTFFWVCEFRRNASFMCKSRIVTKLNDDLKHVVVSRCARAHNHKPKEENYVSFVNPYSYCRRKCTLTS